MPGSRAADSSSATVRGPTDAALASCRTLIPASRLASRIAEASSRRTPWPVRGRTSRWSTWRKSDVS